MLINNVFIRKLRAPVFNTPLWIIVSNNISKSIDTVEDLIDKRIAGDGEKRSIRAYTYAFENHDGKANVLIFLTHRASPGEIAHEAHHATGIILAWHGVKPSFTNDEAESYFLEQIVDKAHSTLQIYHKKKSNEKSKTIVPCGDVDVRNPVLTVGAGGNQT